MGAETEEVQVTDFLDYLLSFNSDSAFNPWNQNCTEADNSDSHHVRLQNLQDVLSVCVATNSVDIWLGRDLGWRGGRRTGVPFVDELTLASYAASIEATSLSKATVGPPMKERTATEIHVARARVPTKIFFWNVFPFHPHEEGNPFTNRMHTRSERDFGLEALEMILDFLPFERIVAIGNDAFDAVDRMGHRCLRVRHPSYGGQRDFHAQINTHYGIASVEQGQQELFPH
ncbi:MAG: uracil-DNA glycosylase [Rhizobiaceae bacterium]|nr:uracil-DNA glycosylase [Rhizobiaceae bacterium]